MKTGSKRHVMVWLSAILSALMLSGCTMLARTSHLYSGEAPPPHTFQYPDGATSVYYALSTGNIESADTAIFFYGGTGCPSWKSVLPGYLYGVSLNANVFVLNKRHVDDRSWVFMPCGQAFHQHNNPDQWAADYNAFITAQLNRLPKRPRNVILVGVSEGALIAARVARERHDITQLTIIGSGGFSMRQSLTSLKAKGLIWFDVEEGWKAVQTDPGSIDKSWYGNRYRWWTDILDLDPAKDLLGLNIPILLTIGEDDHSVPVDSARYLERRFSESGKRNLRVIVYPHADHLLRDGDKSYRSSFFEELSRAVIDTPTGSGRSL